MKKGKKITLETIKARDMKRGDQTIAGETLEGCKADIAPGKSIRIHGTYQGFRDFDKTFKIGDTAEYGSYNLHYLGPIVGIGAKTVTIINRHDVDKEKPRKYRLSIYQFCWRNHDLDFDRIAERNHDVMMHC